jgi:hypothetical protein
MNARLSTGLALLLATAVLAGCARTERVAVPPRIDLARYGTLGVVEFTSNAPRRTTSAPSAHRWTRTWPRWMR